MSPIGGLLDRFARHLARTPGLIPPGTGVLVAFSGGPDSTALLDLLRASAPHRDLRVVAAHFDHGVRPDSRREARRVSERARRMGVEVRVGRAGEKAGTGHDELRRRRYRFLRRVAAEVGVDRIATGHQADDQAETVLFRLLRGTGLRGLRGIPERRDGIVRPLLPFRERELLEHLEARGLTWSRDPANRDPSYARSRIRHELLPALERVWEGDPVERLLSLGRAAREAEDAMEGLTGRVLDLCRIDADAPFIVPDLTADDREERRVRLARRPVLATGRELQARLLRRVARSRGRRLSRGGTAEGVEFINAGRSGGRIQLGGGLELRREFDSLWVGPADPPPDDRPLAVDASTPGSGRLRIGGREYTAEWGPGAGPRSCPHSLAIPREIRQLSLTLRGWRDGDRIELPRGHVKLKELFNRRRVPRSERSRLPLMVDGESEVLWIPGVEDALRREATEEDWWIGVRA